MDDFDSPSVEIGCDQLRQAAESFVDGNLSVLFVPIASLSLHVAEVLPVLGAAEGGGVELTRAGTSFLSEKAHAFVETETHG